MAENSKIEWTNHTFNPWIGCTKVSPACDHCYAEHLMDHRLGRVQWGQPGEVGTRERTSEANWRQPLKWDHAAQFSGRRAFVFCASLADVFDNQVPPLWRHDLFALIRRTPHLTWLLLTKRPQNIRRLTLDIRDGWPSNAAMGCTVVTQDELKRDMPFLGRAKADLKPAFDFVSIEPMLGPMDVSPWLWDLDWVICGGETDQGSGAARYADPEWFRALRDQCAVAKRPFHLKQMTRKAPIPADLQIQERPELN